MRRSLIALCVLFASMAACSSSSNPESQSSTTTATNTATTAATTTAMTAEDRSRLREALSAPLSARSTYRARTEVEFGDAKVVETEEGKVNPTEQTARGTWRIDSTSDELKAALVTMTGVRSFSDMTVEFARTGGLYFVEEVDGSLRPWGNTVGPIGEPQLWRAHGKRVGLAASVPVVTELNGRGPLSSVSELEGAKIEQLRADMPGERRYRADVPAELLLPTIRESTLASLILQSSPSLIGAARIEIAVDDKGALTSVSVDATNAVRAAVDTAKPLASRFSRYAIIVDRLGVATSLVVPEKSVRRPPRAPGLRLSMELAVGDCLNGADPFTVVSCSEPHSAQVYDLVRMGAPGDRYPANIAESILSRCRQIPRASLRPDVGNFPFTYWVMNEAAWTSFDAVLAPCLAKFDPPSTRSILA